MKKRNIILVLLLILFLNILLNLSDIISRIKILKLTYSLGINNNINLDYVSINDEAKTINFKLKSNGVFEVDSIDALNSIKHLSNIIGKFLTENQDYFLNSYTMEIQWSRLNLGEYIFLRNYITEDMSMNFEFNNELFNDFVYLSVSNQGAFKITDIVKHFPDIQYLNLTGVKLELSIFNDFNDLNNLKYLRTYCLSEEEKTRILSIFPDCIIDC